jgi:hypothetical protein
MADILLNSEISKGLIVGNFIWGRSGSNNYLTREDHPDYIAAVTKKVERAIRPGDIVKSSNETLLYIGPVFTYNLSYEDSDKSTQYSYYHRDEKRKHVFSTRAVTATSHLFMPCNEKGVVGRAVDYHGLANYSTKTDIKKLVIVGEIDPPEFPADGTTVSGMDYRGFKKLFQTKAALKAFSMTDDEVYAFYRGLKHPDKINPVSRKHT